MNAPAEIIESAELAMGKPIAYELAVGEDVMESLSVFRLMATQWNAIAGMGGVHYMGIRYESLPVVMRFLGVPSAQRRGMFLDVRMLESGALNVLNAPRR